MDLVGDCDQVISQTMAKMDLIVRKDKKLQRIKQQDDNQVLKQQQQFQRQMDIIQRKRDKSNKVPARKRNVT